MARSRSILVALAVGLVAYIVAAAYLGNVPDTDATM
jgi:hypothetical protein